MKYCPTCSTELILRHDVKVCPRNEIGDCHYDGYDNHENRNSLKVTQLTEGLFHRVPEQ